LYTTQRAEWFCAVLTRPSTFVRRYFTQDYFSPRENPVVTAGEEIRA